MEQFKASPDIGMRVACALPSLHAFAHPIAAADIEREEFSWCAAEALMGLKQQSTCGSIAWSA